MKRKPTAEELALLEQIHEAWTDPGINRQYHERMKARVRMNMPILARHLDSLEKTRNTDRRPR